MSAKTEAETISAAMAILGSRTSKKKAAASRENGKLGGAPRKYKGNSRQRRTAARKAHLSKKVTIASSATGVSIPKEEAA